MMTFPMVTEDQKRAEALRAGERRLLEMVASGSPLPSVLDSLCSLVETFAGGCRCSVLLTDSGNDPNDLNRARLQHGAAPSLPPSLNDAIHGRSVIPYWGPCAMAVHEKTQVIVADVASDSRWESNEWRNLVLGLGLRSCWTTPILSLPGKVLGTFAIYQPEPGSPTPLQQDLIGQLTHIASIAIERARGEAELGKLRSELAHVSKVTTLLPRLPELALQSTPVVFIVDDDVSVRESLELLVRWAGWRTETFSSAEEFLARPAAAAAPSCLVLDVNLPDMNGLDLQARIAAERRDLPIIFLTGHADVPTTVQAMKAGAVEFLTKPFEDGVLLDAIRHAIERSQAALAEAAEVKALRERYDSLTRREREVMALVVAGLLNKQIGAELGTSEITVKAHRGKVMRKMKADSLADLVRTAARLDLPLPAAP